ncbi:MAG: hypothetical protein AAF657_37695 [Acidobacteriota bacterium]
MAKKRFPALHPCLFALGLVILAPAVSRAGEELTLRINDTAGEAGERVAVVLRTYAPRSISQGQICFRGTGRAQGGGSPFATLEEVRVYSELGDVEVTETFDGTSQTLIVEFESLSATINWADGPLAVFFFRLDSSLTPGQEFPLELDLGQTFTLDDSGQTIPLELRGGTLTVRQPGAPYELAAEGDEVPGGDVAILGIETSELFLIGSGQVALEFDPAFAAGPPTVTMDERHGMASFTVDDTVPGRVVVTFGSAAGTLNEVPGEFIRIALPTATTLPTGSQSLVTLDPLLTRLDDPAGGPIDLQLVGDVLVLGASSLVFSDGFESGDLSRWQ